MRALLRSVESTMADVIFLQEVSKVALTELLRQPWIEEHWYASEADCSAFGKQKVPLPSRFDRDALCCDLLVNSSSGRTLRIRLINVHLDSLPINPSRRPQQFALVTAYLSVADRGLIAGDFNPVLPEDADLVSANELEDAWTSLHPPDPGFTWGVNGEHTFPPNRLDKVALVDLKPSNMRVMRTHEVDVDSCTTQQGEGILSKSPPHFSDHFGVLCEVEWMEDR
ncbi:hypothetical protein BDW02DRAFT_604322 [Decorospora gaudefroyi]|uniref:Endonuclease/exonuclease/phosphatase domain-containing protein n=1 Tax=Decorospora gaudefroyi TaxID=184978 RepID=A0A6A5KTU8_9PLEO|nr:hypothetical protein BDW02DRAFT_604322 [Decorospora gaudefroyi]